MGPANYALKYISTWMWVSTAPESAFSFGAVAARGGAEIGKVILTIGLQHLFQIVQRIRFMYRFVLTPTQHSREAQGDAGFVAR